MRLSLSLSLVSLLGILSGGCAGNSSFDALGASVLAQTGYVDESQAKGVFSAGKKLVKSQEALTSEQEYYLGRAVSARVLSTFPPKLEPNKVKYLNDVGMSLVAVSDLPETFGGYHFVVVETPTINALSAPGGFVYVSSGFIDALRDEDELAAVIAHEIAHIVNRDGVKAISNAALFSALSEASTQGAAVALNNVASPVDLGAITATFSESVDGVMEKLLTKGFERSQEYRADLYAAKLLQRAGYDPNALIRVLSILKERSSDSSEGWYATHPAPADRIEEVESDFNFPKEVTPAPVRGARFHKFVSAMTFPGFSRSRFSSDPMRADLKLAASAR